ncbi:Zn-dependent hydrolase [Phycisphaera mikurensis]|nr:Zn-dependent hydrolase [Phycisphaera mikurensis]MBB6443070.1 allantoate deiminase [Phycisphaera mikurensis]
MLRCDAIAACSEEEDRITRRYLTPAMKEAHGKLAGWMRSAGLAPRTDAAGNLIGRRSAAPLDGSRPRVLLLGSHIDSVPGAGRYDGVLGVLAALAAVEAFGRREPLPFHVDVVAFSEEEGVRYATPYLGSRAVAGTFDYELLTRPDRSGVLMEDAIRAFGQNPRLLPEAAYRPEDVLGFVETHLEQGPLLEAAGRSVGVVSAVAGQSRLLVRLTGRTAHAGTRPMDQRQDALLAAAGVVAAVRAEGLATPGLKATVGRLDVLPNTRNVVPGRVDLSMDVRHAEDAVRVAAVGRLLEQAIDLAAAEGCELTVEENQNQPAVKMDAKLGARCGALLAELGQAGPAMVSGAGHDAVVMAAEFPAALLFLRHPGGISHHLDEAADVADVAVAVELLVRLMKRLAAPDDPRR